MERYYFTFGSYGKFPYKNTYMIVVASSYGDAVNGFRERYPDVNPGCLNCSGCYSEKLNRLSALQKEPETTFSGKILKMDMWIISTMNSMNLLTICQRLTEDKFCLKKC